MSKINKLILILIIISTIGLRLFNWDLKFSYNSECNKLWSIQKMFTERKIPLIGYEAVTYLHHLHYPPFFIYLFAPISYISHYDSGVIELSLIIFSGFTTWLFFIVGRKLVNIQVGLIIAFLYAVSFYIQRADRFIWVVGLMYAFAVGFLYIYLKILLNKKKTLKYASILGGIISLGLNFHYQIILLAIPLLILSIYNLYIGRFRIKSAISFIIGILVFIFPLIIFDIKHNFYNTQGVWLLLNYKRPDVFIPIVQKFSNAINLFAGLIIRVFIPPTSGIVTDLFMPTIISIMSLISFGLIILYLWKSTNVNLQKSFLIFCLLSFIIGICSYTLIAVQFAYYLQILQPLILIIISWFIYKIFVINKYIMVVLLTVFVFVNLQTDFSFKLPLSYRYQKQYWSSFLKENKDKNEISIFFSDRPSEEYSLLLYNLSFVLKFDYSKLKYYEQWNYPNTAEFIVINNQIQKRIR